MTKPQPNSAQQSEQTNTINPELDSAKKDDSNMNHAKPTPKLKVDFSHRHGSHGQDVTPLNLTEMVDTASSQAIGVLNMLSAHFTGETEGVSDEIIFWSIESAIATIKDIKAVVNAYHLAMKGGAE